MKELFLGMWRREKKANQIMGGVTFIVFLLMGYNAVTILSKGNYVVGGFFLAMVLLYIPLMIKNYKNGRDIRDIIKRFETEWVELPVDRVMLSLINGEITSKQAILQMEYIAQTEMGVKFEEDCHESDGSEA